jgi:hypothetical protein
MPGDGQLSGTPEFSILVLFDDSLIGQNIVAAATALSPTARCPAAQAKAGCRVHPRAGFDCASGIRECDQPVSLNSHSAKLANCRD